MGKVTFTYDTFEDQYELNKHIKAHDYYLALCHIDVYCRQELKYNTLNENEEKIFNSIRELIGDLIND